MSEMYRPAFAATSWVIGSTAVILGLLALLALFGWWLRRSGRREVERARSAFRDRAAGLAEAFRAAGEASGMPRGLRWAGCEWTGESEFARDRRTGRLVALAGAVLRFEAVEGGDMEDVEAVGLPRAVTAVLVWDGTRWEPTGRVVMNHDPADVLARFGAEFGAA